MLGGVWFDFWTLPWPGLAPLTPDLVGAFVVPADPFDFVVRE